MTDGFTTDGEGHVDRRDALKKIAAGGATAAAATTIVSRPAFANYDPPTFIGEVTSAGPGVNGAPFVCRVFYTATGECPNSATDDNLPPPTIFISDGGTRPVTIADDNGVRLRIVTGNGEAFILGDTFNVTIQLEGTCQYTGGTGTPGNLTAVYQIECTTEGTPPDFTVFPQS